MTVNDIDQKEIPLSTQEEVPAPSKLEGSVPDSAHIKVAADALKLNATDSHQYEDKLRTILQYVRGDDQNMSPDLVALGIKNLENYVGSPQLGQRTVDLIYRLVILRTERDRVNKEIGKLGGFYGK